VAIPVHLENGAEFTMSTDELLDFGKKLFTARWTSFEGQGRPLMDGTGQPLTDMSSPLVFPRNNNRISGPDAASCAVCHAQPLVGGGGDFAMGVFVGGQRFDFITFDRDDTMPTRGSVDEAGNEATLQSIANLRKVVGMSGSGFVEMLARQITADLQEQAAACSTGSTCTLSSKGISFGALTHEADGTWDTSAVEGLPAPSVASSGTTPPSLVIRPFHQSGIVVSIREFTNNAFNHHHGMQSEERFGKDADADGDGFINELTRADITAATFFQAAMAVPGQVIPSDPVVAEAIAVGEETFAAIGCTTCHTAALPLTNQGWMYSEPNPYNPPGNLRPEDGVQSLSIDLTSDALPEPRLQVEDGVVMVPAYTDLKLHDITTGRPSCASNPELVPTGECDGDMEALDLNQPEGSPEFFAGNRKFVTRKLWGIANQHSFGHHGQYTTLREVILAHNGEALATKTAFLALSPVAQGSVIEFLKSLQILPPGTKCRIVNENFECTEKGSPAGIPIPPDNEEIGREISIPVHLENDQEFSMPLRDLVDYGKKLFVARWTSQEGQGRPLLNGQDGPLRNPLLPLLFPLNFNRLSGPAAGACSGCHDTPIAGGGGDIMGSVFILANRFDFASFNPHDTVITSGSHDENGKLATLQGIGNNRKSIGMFGSGFIEMLARQITVELQAQAAACAPGSTCPLSSKGVSYGMLIHNADGTWNTSQVAGLPEKSVATSGTTPPNLIIQPLNQVGANISLRQFTNNSFVRLHGMESEERFGHDLDPDGDGFVNELTRADITAVTVFQATLAVPGQVIPQTQPERDAILLGEQLFASIGCTSCHIPALPLTNEGWIYSEPNPFNPPGNLQISQGVPSLYVDLLSSELPSPRLEEKDGVVMVPAYTDMKLHDITTGRPGCIQNPELTLDKCDPNVEPVNQNAPTIGSAEFFAGNRRYLTRRLWAIGNEQTQFGHHGQYTTMREAVLAHFGEALATKQAFEALTKNEQGAIIMFMKSLQSLPPGTQCRLVDENYECLNQN
jgi:hypothetical protein